MHVQFIGEILDVKADEDVLGPGGYPDAARVQPLIFTPVNRAYHTVGEYAGQAFSLGLGYREDHPAASRAAKA